MIISRWYHNPKKLCTSFQLHSPYVITRYIRTPRSTNRTKTTPHIPPNPQSPAPSSPPHSSSASPSTPLASNTPHSPDSVPFTNTSPNPQDHPPPLPSQDAFPSPPLYPPLTMSPIQQYPYPYYPSPMPPNYNLPPSLALAFAFISASYQPPPGQYPPYPYPPPPEATNFPLPTNLEAGNLPPSLSNPLPTYPDSVTPPPNLTLQPNFATETPNNLDYSQSQTPQPPESPPLQNLQGLQPPPTQRPPIKTQPRPTIPQKYVDPALFTTPPNEDAPARSPTANQPSVYSGFLLKLCKQNDLEGVDNMLSTIQDKGVQLEPSTYYALLAHMCKTSDDVRIRKLQTTMMAKNIPYDTSTVLALFSYHVQCGNAEAAVHLIRKPPKGVTYTSKDGFTILESVTHRVSPMECAGIFEVLHEAGVPVTPAARNLVLDHCVKKRDWYACERMLAYLLENPRVPNNAFIVALRTLARLKQDKLVINVLDMIHGSPLKHAAHIHIYTAVLDAVRELEHVNVLEALKQDISNKRIRPTKEMCEIMIGSAYSCANYREVVRWYRIAKKMGYMVNPYAHKDVLEAFAYLDWVDNDFCEALSETYSGLYNAFHLARANKNTVAQALIFRAAIKHQLTLLPAIVNFAMPIFIEYARKEVKGEIRTSERVEELIGKGWSDHLVEALSLCKRDGIELWPRVHARVQEYVKWRTDYNQYTTINSNNTNEDRDTNNITNEISNHSEQVTEIVHEPVGGGWSDEAIASESKVESESERKIESERVERERVSNDSERVESSEGEREEREDREDAQERVSPSRRRREERRGYREVLVN